MRNLKKKYTWQTNRMWTMRAGFSLSEKGVANKEKQKVGITSLILWHWIRGSVHFFILQAVKM